MIEAHEITNRSEGAIFHVFTFIGPQISEWMGYVTSHNEVHGYNWDKCG